MTSSTNRFLYLPSGYKQRKNTVVTGRAKTGEVSPNGLVAHTEDWEGRIAAQAAPAGIHYIQNPDGSIRPMTMRELVERGYFFLGKGPSGIRRMKEGTH